MGIKPKFKIEDVAKAFDKLLNFIDTETVRILHYVGQKAVTHARSIKPPDEGGRGFKDQTGNLRSSIGFAVYYNGRQIESSYPGNKPQGVNTGQALADKVGRETSGYALVVTAGMFYAVYVESKGRDVLTSAESRAADWLKDQLDDMTKAITDYWKKL